MRLNCNTQKPDHCHIVEAVPQERRILFRALFHALQITATVSVMQVVFTLPAVSQVFGPPALSAPPNGSTNQATTLVLSWDTSFGASSYEVQVSTSSQFNTIVLDGTGIAGTSRQIGPLSNATTYYWRVRASGLLGTTNWSAAWSFATIQSAPGAPTLLSPANGATNQPTSQTLSWNAAAGASSYHLQVSSNASFTPIVVDDSSITGTSMTVGSLQGGATYYWRVSAANGGGQSPYSTSWSFTTAQAAPAAPTLLSPADASTNQPTSLTLSWNSSAGASAYHVQVSSSSSFIPLVFDESSITSTSTTVGSLQGGATYYWRVSASNSGGQSPYSTSRSFTTAQAAPAAPTLLSPADASTNQPTSLTLSWNSSAGASAYHAQVSSSSSFIPLVFDDSSITGTSTTVGSLQNGATYYWRVSASSAAGQSPFSGAWSFTTSPAVPGVPTLISPVNGATNQAQNLKLSWNASAGAATYHLQVSSTVAFSTPVYDDSSISATSIQMNSLDQGATYYWRVSAASSGGASAWSQVWTFATAPAAPKVPVLDSPPNGTIDQPLSTTLRWNAVSGSTSYHLQLSVDQTFSSTLVDQGTLPSTSYTVSGLSVATKYYWRVSASNASGAGAWSEVWCFVTVPNAPTSPSLVSPANTAKNVPLSPVLTWSAVNGSTTYDLQVSTSAAFSTVTVDQSLPGTSYSPAGLAANATYYWRVSAANAGGASAWSAVWSFMTVANPPSGPVLNSPADGATSISLSPVLSWNSVANADSYHLQVSDASAFTSLIVDQTSLPATSSAVNGLSSGTRYYWRVSANNAGGSGAWSAVWSFTTASATLNPPVLQSPADGASNVPTNSTLTWNPSSGASSYRLQLSKDSGFASPTTDVNAISSTSYAVSGLSNGTSYFWRVNATYAGKVSSWSVPFKFSTIPSAPSAPAPVSPASGAANQPTALAVHWDTASGAQSYQLQLSSDSTLSSKPLYDTSLSQTSCQVGPLSENMTYYWHVRSVNSGGTSSWSKTSDFHTQSQPQSGPTLVSPPNGALSQPQTLTLTWNSVSLAGSYQLQVSLSSAFNSTVFDNSTITQTSQTVGPLTSGTTYYWRVRAYTLLSTSDWSETWAFTIVSAAPASPVLSSPANNSTNQPTSLSLSWSPSSGATAYRLQVSASSSFSTVVIDDSSLTSTTKAINGLNSGSTYYWRVCAKNSGGSSQWSSVWSFATSNASVLASPGLVSPPNGSMNQPATCTLQWTAAKGAQTYQVEVSNNPFFSVTIVDDSTVTDTSKQVGPMAGSTTYYWRVRSGNSSSWGQYSTAWSFTIAAGSPSTLTLLATTNFPAYDNSSQFKESDYRIVGLPGGSGSPLNTLIPGAPGSDWLAFWDNGQPNNFYLRYDGSPIFSFAAGRAFWLIKKGAWNINATVPAVALDPQGEASVSLHSGWNLITNPFLNPVAWSSIQTLNKISEPLYSYNGSFVVSGTLNPYVGYYFFNATLLDSLRILPGAGSGLSKISDAAYDVEPLTWRVRVNLSSPEGFDSLLWLGTSPLAKEGRDNSDFHKPHSVGSAPALYFHRPDWDSTYSWFASDIRPVSDHLEEWPFKVSSSSHQRIDLAVEGASTVPANLALYLLDEARGTYVNLRVDPLYSFTPVGTTTALSILVGDENSIRQRLMKVTIPAEFRLEPNYPNPFNPSTTITVEVARKSDASLIVYSSLGQEVRRLYTGSLDPGRFQFVWDGRNQSGQPVSSGVYYCRFVSSAGILATRSMILMK